MANKHMPWDLAQMQSLPLEAKIRMSKERTRIWFENWKKYTIYNTKTKKTRFVTSTKEPSEKGVYVKKKKKGVEVEVLVPGTKLKPTEYIKTVEDGQAYVGFSGGKDSTVLADLCAQVCQENGWTLYLLFVNTGLEYPEIQKFVKTFAEWLRQTYSIEVVLEIVRPEMRFDEVLKKYGYPVISKEISQIIREAKIGLSRADGSYKYRIQRITGTGKYAPQDGKRSRYDVSHYKYMLEAPCDVSEECCKVMKKQPSRKYSRKTGRKPILGTMACESRLRNQRWMKYGCNAFEATGDNQSSNPISFWTQQDILHYIKEFNVPYCSVYGDIVIDEKVDGDSVLEGQVNLIDYLECYEPEDKLKTTGCDRTGCIFCMFGCHLENEPNRFQRLKETHPRQYEYCINGGEYVVDETTEAFAQSSNGEWRKVDWIGEDGEPMTQEEIAEFVNSHKNDENWKFTNSKWQPSKEGLGLGKVLDYIGVKYD